MTISGQIGFFAKSYHLLWALIWSAIPLWPFCVLGQENSSPATTNQLWMDYNFKYKLSDRFSLAGPIGIKTIFPRSWSRYYISPEIRYTPPKLMLKSLQYHEELRAGIEFYYNNNFDGTNVVEVSPYQGYSLTWPNNQRLALGHYLKLRERFQFDTEKWEKTFGLKLSYEITFTLKFQGDIWEYGKGFYLPVSMKFYWNLIDAAVFNNVFRITPGLGYQISPGWKSAFLIGYNRTRNGVDEQFKTNDVIFRLRVYHSLVNKKKS
ncbi:DUF2490 domain-containing protein [Flexithrix dorotheae]|uniref:DUF2490 domain-containing protein n=1 Tax=Flexithrix dorotheae TaxID=70993 RepID=UPI00037C4F44|nr:DUF2490 domain-containing protein [Flexithrix dorotheae]